MLSAPHQRAAEHRGPVEFRPVLPNPDQRHLLHIDDLLHGDLLHGDLLHGDLLHGVHPDRLDDRSLA